ncbi:MULTISPECIES: hypothetical protein [Phyllobacteriaceae]|jgi:hypothetical protein|uniref:Uncharacterized protein n=1 Tax=Tianweitania sediminis TaxID=1502156 RepID=A0A8J7RN26_9HYPH|nr:hypothetical protein [Tianweitania sediminis]MBP0440136.1 hypothetical protein [Tianweitania sediminis]MCO5157101.1 hypothetical protein [Aquamicrobium sp.]
MSRSSTAAFWSKKDWPRQFLTGLLLLVFSAFAVLGTAHASSSTHATHLDQAVASAQHDVSSQHSDDRSEAADERCCHPEAAPDLDCGQVCTFLALLPDPLPALPALDGEPPLRIQHSVLGRNPSGILRPPRLTTIA